MKNVTFYIAAVSFATAMTSCKDGKKEMATTTVNNYATYVDSISKLDSKEALLNWEEIEGTADYKKKEAESAVANVSDKAEHETKISTASDQFNSLKVTMEAERQKAAATDNKTNLRNSLFGGVDIGDDMNFSWVNKDNIASVYDNFVTTVSNNKDSYSREDWDEIKLLYEALDAHKNTVEKNGLSGKDNTKIAGLKIKFSTMYRLNRIDAKSEENAAAKQ